MHEEKTPDISVVVPTYNQADLLRENLRSLVDQTLPKDSYEIVVVDDGSTDHTAAVLREFAGPVRIVQLPANRGRSAARNEGIRHALGRLVTFVDSDILVRRDFLAQHLDAYRSNGPGVLSRGPVVLVPDVQTARDSPMPRLTSSPAFLDTANASVERSALLKAGLFDERFPGYGWEDFELGIRLRRLGIRRVFCRQAVGFHVQPPITQASIQNLLRKEDERAKSAVYFYRKHPTVEVRLLIQATSVHRLLYSIQSGFGLLTPTNVEHIAARLRRSGRNGLAELVMRGVLNRHYVQRLDDELAQSRHRG